MKKTELEILGRAFDAEIAWSLKIQFCHLLQTKSKLAKKLVDEGYLRFTKEEFTGGLTIEGYELTHLGRIEYCTSVE